MSFQTSLVDFHQMKNQLILSCSAKKKPHPTARAIDLYEGQAFRMVREFLKENPDADLGVNVLSAKYGLIDALEENEDLWEPYDLIMDPILSADWRYILQEVVNESFFTSRNSFFYGSELYYRTLPFRIPHSHGPIGKQLHQLKEWLESIGGNI